MRVLTLGWEYPPHIAGGLGTACKALTDSLANLGVAIDLVVPHLHGDEAPTPARLVDAGVAATAPLRRGERAVRTRGGAAAAMGIDPALFGEAADADAEVEITHGPHRFRIPALLAPYWRELDETAANWLAAALGAGAAEAVGAGVATATGAAPEALASLAAAAGAAPATVRAAAATAAPGAPRGGAAEGDLRLVGGGHADSPEAAAGAASTSAGGSATDISAPQRPPMPAPPLLAPPAPPALPAHAPPPGPPVEDPYGSRLFHEVRRFSEGALRHASRGRFDLVHAHDWMTFPAGVACADALGCPLVVHVHSTEYDRAGEGASARIVEVERFGMEAATLVVAVSHYTRSIIVGRYAIAPDKVAVVHNGVYPAPAVAAARKDPALDRRQVVLYLGRVTYQKGPDYFVEAAARIAAAVPRAHFVLAGAGDMLPRLRRRVDELGLTDRFSFPGFLRGADVERMFCQADVFVMPSVSEPFGLVALEAMSNRTPVVVSRQSGVAETLRHVLKFDFWEVDDLAAKVTALLRYPEVRREMVARAAEEVTRFQWEAAARRVRDLYERALAGAHARSAMAS